MGINIKWEMWRKQKNNKTYKSEKEKQKERERDTFT